MSKQRRTQAERRVMVERCLEEDFQRSDRAISRVCAVSHSHVGSIRRELQQAGRIQPRPARPAADRQSGHANLQRGGSPRLQSGARSERVVAPLRSEIEDELRAEYGEELVRRVLGDRRLRMLADLLARIERAERWLDEKGSIARRGGEPWPIVRELERWSQRADAVLATLQQAKAAAAAADPDQSLADALADGAQAWTRNAERVGLEPTTEGVDDGEAVGA